MQVLFFFCTSLCTTSTQVRWGCASATRATRCGQGAARALARTTPWASNLLRPALMVLSGDVVRGGLLVVEVQQACNCSRPLQAYSGRCTLLSGAALRGGESPTAPGESPTAPPLLSVLVVVLLFFCLSPAQRAQLARMAPRALGCRLGRRPITARTPREQNLNGSAPVGESARDPSQVNRLLHLLPRPVPPEPCTAGGVPSEPPAADDTLGELPTAPGTCGESRTAPAVNPQQPALLGCPGEPTRVHPTRPLRGRSSGLPLGRSSWICASEPLAAEAPPS